MAIVRWDPVRELASMHERLNRLFEEFGGRAEDEGIMRGDFLPPVDIYQTDAHEVVLKAEIPGLKKEDIDLRIEQNTLTITGERRVEKAVEKDHYHRMERTYGTFSRSFSLPSTIDTEKVRAEYKDGVLSVTLPLREESKPKQISVEVKS
jgi:HSP20 family protein